LKGKGGRAPAFWVTLENGTESTESPELIHAALARLRDKRELVTLVSKGYQSPKTVIVHYSQEELEIDKPLDWPDNQSLVSILFKDEALVWNQIRVRVLRVVGNSIFTEFPPSLVRLQRRANYRVGVPNGSTALFRHDGVLRQGFQVVDISANGVLLCAERQQPLAVGSRLGNLELFFPGPRDGQASATSITIRQARVMRTARDDNNKKYCYGIFFELSPGEEEVLLQFVRLRERELLRKGLSD